MSRKTYEDVRRRHMAELEGIGAMLDALQKRVAAMHEEMRRPRSPCGNPDCPIKGCYYCD